MMMEKNWGLRIFAIFALVTTLALPAAAQEASKTKSGYEDVPQFGGPGSVGSDLKKDDEVRKPWFRLEGLDKTLKPWFDWKGRLNKNYGFSFGLDYTALGQVVSESAGEDSAVGGIFRFFGNWTVIGRDSGNTGSIVYKLENRHRLGTDIPPQDLGFEGGYLGIPGTAFSDYDGWGLTNLFRKQGKVGDIPYFYTVGYLIPCHRVISKSGKIHQYRWGSARKKAIEGWEASQAG